MGKLCAAIVTYCRVTQLSAVLDSIASQTLQPNEIVVVDNEGSRRVRDLCDRHALRGRLTYLAAGENLGPAGGTALAMDYFLRHYSSDDWFTRFDDDKSAPDENLLHELIEFAQERRLAEAMFGGVGLAGSRWDYRRARLSKVAIPEGAVGEQVDFLATGFFPVFSGEAIRAVGPMDASLFFGMSEVEYGLRIRQAGYSLWLHGDRVRARRGPSGVPSESPMQATLGEFGWRRYYSLRNSIVVARRYGGFLPAMRVTVFRALAKPIWGFWSSPRFAIVHLRLGIRAVTDAWLGRMGRRIDPNAWEKKFDLLDDQGEMRST
jgi:rhamnopyranosyl-N-acetylglucosaminyl-diphospho-decaprenol beta-1,3/1,4-galactofuranosyltransferase